MQEKIFNYKEQTENSVFIMLKVVLSLFSNLQYATEMSKRLQIADMFTAMSQFYKRGKFLTVFLNISCTVYENYLHFDVFG